MVHEDKNKFIDLQKVKPSNISFIIPAYNCAETVSLSIESIINGNIEEGDEIVIVDDGSTDDTLQLINNYGKKHDFIKIIQHSSNQGGSAARNTAVKNSKNELIFCLDSDNILMPSSIKKLKCFLFEHNADAVAFQECIYFTDSIEKWNRKWVFRPGRVKLADCLVSPIVPISSGNYLYTKESWKNAGGYPLSVGALDTWGFGFIQIALNHKVLVLKKSGYYHKYGYDSYWVRDSRNEDLELKTLSIIEPFFDKLDKQSIDFINSPDGRAKLSTSPKLVPRVTGISA